MADTSKTILVVAAHPDDCDVACGGSAAKWAAEGQRVILCVATNGNKGSGDLEMTSEQLVQVRDKEQRAAARVMGIQEASAQLQGSEESLFGISLGRF
jgi:LmbE family N-acetylglucosaminyl deacetylase